MDEQRFDQLSRRFASMRTRRQAVKALAGAVIGVMAGTRAASAQTCAAHYSPCGGDGECCAGSVCEYGLCMPGCRINGTFVSAGITPPDNSCGQCQPEISTTSLVPVNEGMSCWGGDPNAGATFCRSGSCVPNPPQSCPPPTPCHLEGSVDPVTGLCVNPPAPAGTPCGGQAMCHDGFYQPADACDGNGFCIGGGSQADYCPPIDDCTPQCKEDGSGCSDVSACTGNDLCIDGACACAPDCTGKTCGDDGCGGFCGSCAWPEICTGETCCRPNPAPCLNSCGGTTSDGCGNPVTCPAPACGPGERCFLGYCISACQPPCAPGSQCIGGRCVNPNTDCVPACPSGSVCVLGNCESTTCDPPCSFGGTCVFGNCVYE